MKIQRLLVVSGFVIAGFAVSVGGCILGSDPNHNATLFLGGNTGTNGGASGAGGPGGNAGMDATTPIVGSGVALFNTTSEGFLLDDYADKAQINLNDPTNPANAGNPAPTLAFDGTQGSPSPGSIAVMAPYSGPNQYVDIQKTFGTNNYQDWTGKTLYVRIKVTSGVFKGGVQLYVKTGGTYFFAGTYTTLATGSNWQTFKINVDAPMMIGPGTGSYDPSHVVSCGMQLNSSGAGLGSTPVTFNIDSFSIDPPVPVVDAGTDVAASDAGSDTAVPTDVAAPTDVAVPTDVALPTDDAAAGN
jgi:hypothetical protein